MRTTCHGTLSCSLSLAFVKKHQYRPCTQLLKYGTDPLNKCMAGHTVPPGMRLLQSANQSASQSVSRHTAKTQGHSQTPQPTHCPYCCQLHQSQPPSRPTQGPDPAGPASRPGQAMHAAGGMRGLHARCTSCKHNEHMRGCMQACDCMQGSCKQAGASGCRSSRALCGGIPRTFYVFRAEHPAKVCSNQKDVVARRGPRSSRT